MKTVIDKWVLCALSAIAGGAVTDRPFTAAVCGAGPCRAGEASLDLLARLPGAVRRCPHGVLIRTGCLLHAARCRAGAEHDNGCYLLVQPCDSDRRPHSAVIPVGPILTRDDAETVTRWLVDGDLDVGLLDPLLGGRPAA
jgi:hypothetical protein